MDDEGEQNSMKRIEGGVKNKDNIMGIGEN